MYIYLCTVHSACEGVILYHGDDNVIIYHSYLIWTFIFVVLAEVTTMLLFLNVTIVDLAIPNGSTIV